MFIVELNLINHIYSVEHSVSLFQLRLTCMLQVSALSQANIVLRSTE